MQGTALLVSGYVFLASLAAPGVLLASDEPAVPGDQPAAAPTSEAVEPIPPPNVEGEPGAGEKEPGDAGEPSAAVPGSSTLEAVPAAGSEPGRARGGGGHRSQAAATTTVAMRDIEFKPRQIKIGVGDTVRWENEDNVEHDALGEDGSFETPIIDGGESSQHTFNKGGEFPYFCSIHQGMTGKIQVGSSSGGGGGGGGSGGTSSGSGGTAAPSGSTSGGAGGFSSSGSGGTTSSLPATGSDLLWLGLFGYGLLAIGAFFRLGAIGR